MEWWDIAFLSKQNRENNNLQYKLCSINNSKTLAYVEVPGAVEPLGEVQVPDTLPLMHTKRERKRIRRQRRMNREKEKHEKQSVGLIEADAPKLKISNFMRVMADDAVAGPTQVEAMVRKQSAQRQKNHDMRNLARKLTPEERKAKRQRKFMEDTSSKVCVALFSVDDLSHRLNRKKVGSNAKQFFLTGVAVLCPIARKNLVVVEGGPKGIRKFKRLMLHRINWSEDEDGPTNKKAALVWEGVVHRRTFKKFAFEECTSTQACGNYMGQRNVKHYWDLVEHYR